MLTGAAILGETTIAGHELSVPRAREFVGLVLGRLHPCHDDARLLVSELVTNSVLHSDSGRPGGAITVVVAEVAAGIRVEVTDQGSAHSVPVIRESALAIHGRGLLLVEALASDWGYARDESGTTVWFHLAAPNR
jgi:anti-sigma regulatory factor (Ser/Thr protein kinase)